MRRGKRIEPCNDGKRRSVQSFRISTPIGNMYLITCSKGLHMIYQVEEICDDNFDPMPEQTVALLDKLPLHEETNDVVKTSISWLNVYFFEPTKISSTPLPHFCTFREDGKIMLIDIEYAPVMFNGSISHYDIDFASTEKFYDHVQLTLAKNITFGKTVSYRELAALTRSPGAFQAVGSAMKNNPFQLMVPCHRVINSGHKLGVYSGGRRNKTKEWLLKHEGLQISDGMVIQEDINKL